MFSIYSRRSCTSWKWVAKYGLLCAVCECVWFFFVFFLFLQYGETTAICSVVRAHPIYNNRHHHHHYHCHHSVEWNIELDVVSTDCMSNTIILPMECCWKLGACVQYDVFIQFGAMCAVWTGILCLYVCGAKWIGTTTITGNYIMFLQTNWKIRAQLLSANASWILLLLLLLITSIYTSRKQKGPIHKSTSCILFGRRKKI